MELKEIQSPKDIKGMAIPELQELSAKLRSALLSKLSAHGGHIGPNLGMVEATVALHYVFNAPEDKIVFDVSHQSYIHKMLTGRIEAFIDPAHYEDVTGYTCPRESPYDLFEIGHTSTSVSLAGGLAKARDLKGGKENVIAVIGDGSLSGGEAFEGLDFAAELGSNFIVVVNDNDMSIAENHGGLYDDLRRLRETDGQSPTNYFKSLGFDYRYVAYGNDVESLIRAFEEVKDTDHPVVVHIATQKGKGYAPAEAHREQFHFGAPFDLATGNPLNIDETPDYSDITANHLMDMAKKDPTVAVITAGTPGVIGFTPERRREMGRQFIDVGIAEQEAVALASGLAKGGAKPFFGVVSSFIQRAYDQMSQDVAINNTPVVMGIFHASMYGMNDVTHLGWFDIALISNIPGWVYLAPTCKEEYLSMLDWAMNQTQHPVAIRVPAVVIESGRRYPADYSEPDKYEVTRRGSDVAILGAGSFYQLGEQTADLLSEKGIHATLINPRFLSGIDANLLDELKKGHRLVVTLEDGVLDGGFGEKIARYYGTSDMAVKCYGLKKEFADRYDYKQLAEACRLTPGQITEDVIDFLTNNRQ
ncbi:MAG: 1-deoxy-D-xylulose-5-phosphate synthase [Pseudoflavonifractor sp.]|nr:1-deoxy-D-xylulose-5-phosphate synthase [Alloprevotella sp.]MCM1116146.1 1-deoxy-D-xylulose-5-phosphate synthase [Pseudoflavonifractor sp.]